jgi:MFS family permease
VAAFSSLSNRNYRLFFYGQLVSQAGNNMQLVAQAWLVLQVSHSGTQLGAVTAVQFVPLLLLGPLGGMLADRFDRRRVLVVSQSTLGLISAVLAAATFSRQPALWEVYVLAAATGVLAAVDIPARQAIVSDLVSREQLTNAVALNSVELNVARVLGPAVAGLLIAFAGVSICFAVNAASFGAVVVGLAMMDGRLLWTGSARPELRGGIRAGFRYARRTPQVFLPLVMVTVLGMFAWEFPVTLPLLAERTFHGGPRAYGIMVAVMGVGAVLGGLWTASRPPARPVNLPLACAAWGAAMLLTAAAPGYPLALAGLVLVGAASVAASALSKTVLQLASAPAMRGRVMALWAIAWQGTTPIGGPVVGWIGQHAGARWAVAVGGIAAVAVGMVTAARWRAAPRLDTSPDIDLRRA